MGTIRVGMYSTIVNIWREEEKENIALEEHRSQRKQFVGEWILIHCLHCRELRWGGQGGRDRE